MYQGKGSYSICVAMFCVAIIIVGAIWFIYYCVTIYILRGTTLGGCSGLLLMCFLLVTSLGVTLGGLPGFLCSYVSICTSLGTDFSGITDFIFCVCTLGVGDWCSCCLVGYWFVTCARPYYGSISTPYRRPLFLLVDFCYAALGMILNYSARFLSSVWCVSLIFSKGAFGDRFLKTSTKSRTTNVAKLVDETLGILTFEGEIPWRQKLFLILFL